MLNRILTLELEDRSINIAIIDVIFRKVHIRLLKTLKYEDANLRNYNLVNAIKNEIDILKIPCRKVSFTLQNKNIINRKINIFNTPYEEDIGELVKYELNQFIPLDIEKYSIQHIISKKEKEIINMQAILIPKTTIIKCKEFASDLKMKATKLCVNFNVVHNLIQNNIIEVSTGDNVIVEIKRDMYNLSFVKERRILESHSIDKSSDIIRYIETNFEDIKYMYIYGLKDEILAKELYSKFEIKQLKLNTDKIEYYGEEDINSFINNIGLVC